MLDTPSNKKMFLNLSQSIKSNTSNYYRTIQILGIGKSATAFLSLKTTSSDRGTFKVVKALQHPDDEVKLARFQREIDVLKDLEHTSIIGLHDTGIFKNHPFYVCDFYSSTLDFVIRSDQAKLAQKLSYAMQMCSAVAHLKSRGVVHCDIKPDNIYINGWKCALADFGLSLRVGDGLDSTILPSLHKYRSPDIVKAINDNKQVLTSKSDVFQLGLVLAELFSGKNPCQPATTGNLDVVLDPIPKIYGKFGTNISEILTDMLRLDASLRPDAESLIDKWQNILFKTYEYLIKFEKNVY